MLELQIEKLKITILWVKYQLKQELRKAHFLMFLMANPEQNL